MNRRRQCTYYHCYTAMEKSSYPMPGLTRWPSPWRSALTDFLLPTKLAALGGMGRLDERLGSLLEACPNAFESSALPVDATGSRRNPICTPAFNWHCKLAGPFLEAPLLTGAEETTCWDARVSAESLETRWEDVAAEFFVISRKAEASK